MFLSIEPFYLLGLGLNLEDSIERCRSHLTVLLMLDEQEGISSFADLSMFYSASVPVLLRERLWQHRQDAHTTHANHGYIPDLHR